MRRRNGERDTHTPRERERERERERDRDRESAYHGLEQALGLLGVAHFLVPQRRQRDKREEKKKQRETATARGRDGEREGVERESSYHGLEEALRLLGVAHFLVPKQERERGGEKGRDSNRETERGTERERESELTMASSRLFASLA
jgi:hypothetical protein